MKEQCVCTGVFARSRASRVLLAYHTILYSQTIASSYLYTLTNDMPLFLHKVLHCIWPATVSIVTKACLVVHVSVFVVVIARLDIMRAGFLNEISSQ